MNHEPQPVDRTVRREAHDELRFSVVYHDVNDWLLDQAQALSAEQIFVPTQASCSDDEPVTLVMSFPGLRTPLCIEGQVASVVREGRRAQLGIMVKLSELSRGRLAEAADCIGARDPAWLIPSVRVLVVDDNVHAAQLIEDGLHLAARRSFGGRIAFHVPRATTTADALTFLRKKPIDALITDVYLGGGSAASLIEYVRADPAMSSVPILAISAGHDLATRRTAMTAGADRFLQKPLRMRELVHAISEILRIESPQD